MNRDLKECVNDCSTLEEFEFSIRCEECGSIWHSDPVRFSMAGIKPETEERKVIYNTVYRREREQAFMSAVKKGKEVFSFCPVCGKLICDACFMICDELDMCRSCAVSLKEKGESVRGNGKIIYREGGVKK